MFRIEKRLRNDIYKGKLKIGNRMNQNGTHYQKVDMALRKWHEYVEDLDRYYELYNVYYDADWSNKITQLEYIDHLKSLIDDNIEFEKKMAVIEQLSRLVGMKIYELRIKNHSPLDSK